MSEAFEVVQIDLERQVVVLGDGEELRVTEWLDEEGEEVPAGLATQAIAISDNTYWWVEIADEVMLQ